MNNPFNFFEKIYCLNLPESTERKTDMIEQFKIINILDRVNFDVYAEPPVDSFNSSIHNSPGEYGNTLSHLKILIDAMKYNKHTLILEDDINFDNKCFSTLQAAIDQLPDNWEILYLGGRPKQQVLPYSNNLVKIQYFISAMSYAVNASCLEPLAKHFTDTMGKEYPKSATDNIINGFSQINKNSFCVVDRITYPTPGLSLAKNNIYQDYKDLQNKAWRRFYKK